MVILVVFDSFNVVKNLKKPDPVARQMPAFNTTAFLSIYKNIVFSFFYFLCFSIYKIVDGEFSTEDYKSPKLIIGGMMKNSEMLKFVPDNFKTKKMCKHAVKKLPFVIRYVPD